RRARGRSLSSQRKRHSADAERSRRHRSEYQRRGSRICNGHGERRDVLLLEPRVCWRSRPEGQHRLRGHPRDGFSRGLPGGAIKATTSGFNQTALDSSRKSDIGDWVNNLNLARGWWTFEQTQLDDALALTRAAKAYAAATLQHIVVVGQSLGGGLAGLVSAIENVETYAISPAPLYNQLRVEAEKFAILNPQTSLGPLNISIDPAWAEQGVFFPDFLGSSDANQRAILEMNGHIAADINEFFKLKATKIAEYDA